MGNNARIRLFQRGIHAWSFLYFLSALPAWKALWGHPLSPELPAPPGPFRYLTHAFGTWLPGSFVLPCVLLVLAVALYGMLRPPKWWMLVALWAIHASLMDRAWLSSNGGQQLMSNALFWSIFLTVAPGSPRAWPIRESAFWIIRLQLVLAYAVTAIQKLSGTHWTHGTSVGIVAGDPDYGPAFLVGMEGWCTAITYAVLAFQVTFPIAVWSVRTRRIWMWVGVAFHLSTIAYGIPDMAFAFLAIYPLWFSESTAQRGLDRIRQVVERVRGPGLRASADAVTSRADA